MKNASGRTWDPAKLREFVVRESAKDDMQDTMVAKDWFTYFRSNRGRDLSILQGEYVGSRIDDDMSVAILSRISFMLDEDGRIADEELENATNFFTSSNSLSTRVEAIIACEVLRDDGDGAYAYELCNLGKYVRFMGFDIPDEWQVPPKE